MTTKPEGKAVGRSEGMSEGKQPTDRLRRTWEWREDPYALGDTDTHLYAGDECVLFGGGFIDCTDVDGPEDVMRAITAVPDLIQAVEMLLERTANPITDHAFYTLNDARGVARAALAKATGETP